eukprot:16428760-Heterocapsa_arctica.AAC.1
MYYPSTAGRGSATAPEKWQAQADGGNFYVAATGRTPTIRKWCYRHRPVCESSLWDRLQKGSCCHS